LSAPTRMTSTFHWTQIRCSISSRPRNPIFSHRVHFPQGSVSFPLIWQTFSRLSSTSTGTISSHLSGHLSKTSMLSGIDYSHSKSNLTCSTTREGRSSTGLSKNLRSNQRH
jgi:hypothetical protein